MFYISTKIKIYIGISFIVLLIIIGQLIYFYKEEPPTFSEITITTVGNEGNNQKEKEEYANNNEIVVDIKGEVINPGVYTMEENSRIDDVITKAGGVTANADLNQVNRAQKIYDEMIIYIPKQGEQLQQVLLDLNNGKISINQAGENELMMLDGIGPAKAKAIIDYRTKNGSFKKIEDIINVPGIGEAIYQQIKDKITIN